MSKDDKTSRGKKWESDEELFMLQLRASRVIQKPKVKHEDRYTMNFTREHTELYASTCACECTYTIFAVAGSTVEMGRARGKDG